jgi:hypothetical protein
MKTGFARLKPHTWDIVKSFHGLEEEGADRLCALIVLHLDIDRLMSLSLYRHLKRQGPFSDKEFKVIARLHFESRRKMAQAAGLLTDQHAAYVKALNEARNQLLHVKANGGFRDHPALTTEMEFLTIYGPATHARSALLEPIKKSEGEAPAN